MTWKRKAYQVAAALDGTIIEWWPMGKKTFASVLVQTAEGVFHACYSKCRYLHIGNNITEWYDGSVGVTVGVDKEGTDRSRIFCNEAKREDVRRILIALLRLPHSDFNREQAFELLLISDEELSEWGLDAQTRP